VGSMLDVLDYENILTKNSIILVHRVGLSGISLIINWVIAQLKSKVHKLWIIGKVCIITSYS